MSITKKTIAMAFADNRFGEGSIVSKYIEGEGAEVLAGLAGKRLIVRRGLKGPSKEPMSTANGDAIYFIEVLNGKNDELTGGTTSQAF